MKQFLTSLALGLLLLTAVVAFALVPGSGAGSEPAEGAEPADDPGSAAADRVACRAFEIGIAGSDLDEALSDIDVALSLERGRGDGGTGFYDWLDTDLVTAALTDVAATAGRAALTPGLTQEVYLPIREVVRLAASLESSAVSGSTFSAGVVADERYALDKAVADVGRACA